MSVTSNDQDRVSIRYTLSLEDGTQIGGQAGGDEFSYMPGEHEIMPALEKAMHGAVRGEKRRIVLTPEKGINLDLDFDRLSHMLGHPGETLVLDVEIL